MSFSHRYHAVSAMVASPALTLFLVAAFLPLYPGPWLAVPAFPCYLLTQLPPVVPSSTALRSWGSRITWDVLWVPAGLCSDRGGTCFSSPRLLRHLSSQSPYERGCLRFPPAPPVRSPVRLGHRSPRCLNEPIPFLVLPSHPAPLSPCCFQEMAYEMPPQQSSGS